MGPEEGRGNRDTCYNLGRPDYMVINVEIILWRYKHVHVYVMWAGPAVGWRGEESLCVHIRTSSKERAPPPPSPPPPPVFRFGQAQGVLLGYGGGGCHYCIIPPGT